MKTRTADKNMKTKTADKNPTTKLAEFSCHAPEAQAVFVAGTFNDWNPEATPLTRQADGHWQIKLPLTLDTMNSSSSWMGNGAASPAASTNIGVAPNACRTNAAR